MVAKESTNKSLVRFNVCYDLKRITPFFYKQSIFDPCPENCLSFSKKSPQKIV